MNIELSKHQLTKIKLCITDEICELYNLANNYIDDKNKKEYYKNKAIEYQKLYNSIRDEEEKNKYNN